MAKEILKFLALLNYGFIALPLAFAGFPLYVLASDFYAVNYGIKLSTLGIVLLIIRLFDAFQDPFIGIISDRYRNKTLLIMGVAVFSLIFSVCGLFNLLFFCPIIWFTICMTVSITSYSILTINLNTNGALWVVQRNHQTKIASVREFFGLIGVITAVSLPNLLETIVLKNEVYKWYCFILLILTIIGFTKFSIWYCSNFKNLDTKKKNSFNYNLKSFSLDSKKFFVIYFISMLASSIPAVLVIFFVRDLLKAEIYTGFFLFLYFVSAICFIPFWNFLNQKYEKYKSWFFSMLVASCSFIWAFFLTKGDLWQYGCICIVSGSALGAELIFPPSIIADHINDSNAKNNASAYYGIFTLIAKGSLAFASGISFFLLDFLNFIPEGKNSKESLMGLSIAYAFIPCILKIGSAFLLWNLLIKSNKENFYEKN